MKIDLRNLDFIKGLLEIINKELTERPRKYARLIKLLEDYMEENK